MAIRADEIVPPERIPESTIDSASPRMRFWRGVALGLLFAPICCYWAQDQGVDRIFSLMVPPVVLTLLLVAVNVLLRRFAPRVALREGELVLFFAMQAVVCAMASEWMDVIQPYTYSYAVF